MKILKTKQTNFNSLKINSVIFKSRTFIKNYLLLISILFFFFIIFALTIFYQSQDILKQEFRASSQYQLDEKSNAIDDHIMDIRYIIAALDTSSIIQSFFTYEHPETIYDGYYNRVQEILKIYVNGFPSIDSIYLYSQCSNTIFTAFERVSCEHFSDIHWMADLYENDSEEIEIYFRAKQGVYPFVLSIMKQINHNGFQGAIIINLKLENLSQLVEIGKEPYQALYIVSDNGEILFRNNQNTLTEPLSNVPELSNYQEDLSGYTVLVNGQSAPYVYTQKHSSYYPWSYCMVTHLQEYTSKLSSSMAIFVCLLFCLFFAILFLAFLLTLRSTRPIRDLLQLLNNPKETYNTDTNRDENVQYIAGRIINYIQKNQALSDELESRLNLLNQTKLVALQSQINPHFLFNTLNMIHIQECEALGYENKIPQLTLGLSRLMRYSIESTNLVSLETELNFTKTYVQILKERYGNKLHVIYNIESSTLNCLVPKLFIQPLIENAIFHGLAKNMNENSMLSISFSHNKTFCIISVQDNGLGISKEKLEHIYKELDEDITIKDKIGLQNVVTRMKLLYNDDFKIWIESNEGEGTTITLQFPDSLENIDGGI